VTTTAHATSAALQLREDLIHLDPLLD